MPRYFFNFLGDTSAGADFIGRALPNDEAAKSEGAKLAADVGVSGAVVGQLPTYEWLEVLDEAQRPVATPPSSRRGSGAQPQSLDPQTQTAEPLAVSWQVKENVHFSPIPDISGLGLISTRCAQ